MTEAHNSKSAKRKWNIFNYNSKSTYDATNEITYKTEILLSNLCDYNYAYILVRGDVTVIAALATQVAFKNCAPFTKCTSKIDETKIDDAENLDLAMPRYNLIKYSSNYSERMGSFFLKIKQLILIVTL